jgi:spore germination protein
MRSHDTGAIVAAVVAVLLMLAALSARAAAYEAAAWSLGDVASLTAAADRAAVDAISVDWYVSQRNATVGVTGEDLTLVATAHARGLSVLATVADISLRTGRFSSSASTHILNRPTNMAQHVTALVDLCVAKGYDGIDIDWEAVRPRNKDKLSSFIAQLALALHSRGKILSMAIATKTSEPGDWSAPQSEDYAALGAAVDEFKVMTYDYSGSWSPPGPISPLAWMDAVLTYAESLVPAAKIMMGVPFYGYNWLGRRTTDVRFTDAQSLIATYGPTVNRDPSGEPTFTYIDTRGRTHSVFFQDRTALAVKLQMLRTDHPSIRGIAIWVMGGEDPAFWDEIRLQLH